MNEEFSVNSNQIVTPISGSVRITYTDKVYDRLMTQMNSRCDNDVVTSGGTKSIGTSAYWVPEPLRTRCSW